MSLLDDIFNSMTNSGNATGTGAAAPLLGVGDTILSAAGQSQKGASYVAQGRQQYEAAQYQAAQFTQNANSAIASSQRASQDQQLQTDYLISKAISIAASGGGGVQDPTVVNTVARIAGESAYRQSVALYQGQDQSRVDTMQAEAKQYEGEAAKQNSRSIGNSSILDTAAGIVKGGAKTLASQGSTLYSRFGANGPNTGGANASAT